MRKRKERKVIQWCVAQVLQKDDLSYLVGEAFAKLVPQVDEAKTLVIKDMTKVSVKERLSMLRKELLELLKLTKRSESQVGKSDGYIRDTVNSCGERAHST